MKYLLLSKKTKQLEKHQIIKICKLKNTHWKYGFKSNIKWFKNNVKSNDTHNLIYFNSKLIGYTHLKTRSFYYLRKKKYIFFDTLIIDKNFRRRKISYYLMNLNHEIILNSNKFSFLICTNKLVEYYKKFGWKLMKKKSFSIGDHKFNTNGMCFNNKVLNNKNKYIFYIHK